jgi:DHA2 family methylenomycin A resistance protein-like MFS transporter
LPSFPAAVAFGVLVNLTYYGVIFVLSLYLQQARGYSAVGAGFAYVPLTATFIVTNVASGWVAARFGSRVPMIAGALTGMVGFVLLGTLGDDSSYLAMLPAFVLIPAGIGLGVPAMTTTVLASVGRPWSGTASGVLNAARQMGGAIGVAAFGALLNGEHDRIVAAVKLSALSSATLLLVAAIVAWLGIGNAPSAAE